MSWLARSLADSLLIDDEDDHPLVNTTSANDDVKSNNPPQFVNPQFNAPNQSNQEAKSDNQPRTGGVKEDLSEFTESLTRQLRGVASFLAPPPPPPPPPPPRRRSSSTPVNPDPSVSDRYFGDSSVSGNGDDDLSNPAYEGSTFEDGTGVFTNTSTFPVGAENEDDKAILGMTEEVLAFATNIAHHPETWLDFPLSEEEEDSDDFEMSDAQWNHATVIEHLTPRLAALRIELCPIHMSESYFWKVYFVLLHSRLSKHDADLLSTPQIVEARAMWMKELQKQIKPEADLLESNEDFSRELACEATSHNTSKEQAFDERVPSFTLPFQDFEDDDDDWVHENSELDGYEGPDVPVETDDISFSDLEDDNCPIPRRSNII